MHVDVLHRLYPTGAAVVLPHRWAIVKHRRVLWTTSVLRPLPSGMVTFAFVDVVESTRAFTEHGDGFVVALTALLDVVKRHTADAGGVVVKTEGDGAFLAFGHAQDAVAALTGLQAELEGQPTDTVPRLRIRSGAHRGPATPVGDDYVALAVNIAARVSSASGAGQVLVSRAVVDGLVMDPGEPVGEYDLKDVAEPMALWRLCGDDAPPRTPLSRRTNVRIPASTFVGRRAEVTELRERLAGNRLVTLLGPGGMGKTRLASELALQDATTYAGGAWLVELASLSSADQILASVAASLERDLESVEQLAAELDRRGRTLLILDNCEHLLDAVTDLVERLAQRCPQLVALCTSREALRLPDEAVMRLGELVGAEPRIELFTERARRGGAIVRDADRDAVVALCDRLDGLPLAIELAAGQASEMTVDTLVDLAQTGRDPLARRGGEGRQRSLDAVVAWSLDRLGTADRDALLVLSVLPGRFTAAMAATILENAVDCSPDAVRRLTRCSLVDLDGDEYRLLETIRHAARRRLYADPGRTEMAALAVRAWAVKFAEDRYLATDVFHEVLPDQLLALEDVLDRGVDDAFRGLGKVWELMRIFETSRRVSARVRELARRALEPPRIDDEDSSLTIGAALSIVVGPTGSGSGAIADDVLEDLVAQAARSAPVRAAALLRTHVAFTYAFRGDTSAARPHSQELLRHAAEDGVGDGRVAAVAHSVAALIHQVDGELSGAERHAGQALTALIRELPDHPERNIYEANRAEALLDVGRAEEALPHALEALRRTTPGEAVRRYVLTLIARAHADLGHPEAAVAAGREAERLMLERVATEPHVTRELAHLRELVPGLLVGN